MLRIMAAKRQRIIDRRRDTAHDSGFSQKNNTLPASTTDLGSAEAIAASQPAIAEIHERFSAAKVAHDVKMKNASPQAIVKDELDLHWAKQMVALQALQADNESDDEYNIRSASGGVMRDLSVAQAQIVERM